MNSNDSCPLPSRSNDPQGVLDRMLKARSIAVVGLSDDPSRPSHEVASYLRAAGKQIIPVNPNCPTVMGLKCYATLEEIPDPVDLVDVFRQPQHCPAIVQSAVKIGAKGVWLQSGIQSPQAEKIAANAGIDFVQDRCLKVEHMFRGKGR